MNDVAADTLRIGAPVVAHLAQSAAWELPSERRSPPPLRSGRMRFMCLACLVLGVAAGHLARDGRCLAVAAADLAQRVPLSSKMPSGERVAREPRVGIAPRVVVHDAVRGKGGASRGGPGQRSAARAPSRRAQAKTSAQSATEAALFVDFEPSFRGAP